MLGVENQENLFLPKSQRDKKGRSGKWSWWMKAILGQENNRQVAETSNCFPFMKYHMFG